MDEWCGNRPQIQPPYMCDSLCPDDENFQMIAMEMEDNVALEDSDGDPCDDLPAPEFDEVNSTSDGTAQRPPLTPTPCAGHVSAPAKGSRRRRRPALAPVPPGVVPVNMNSSTHSGSLQQHASGNTVVRRKHVSSHTIVAEAIRATGTLMASQMQAIAAASLAMEKSKMEVWEHEKASFRKVRLK